MFNASTPIKMSEDFNKELIDLVHKEELIYNHFHPNHKNREELSTAWSRIARQLNTTSACCQTRWRTLRTSYVKKHRKIVENPEECATDPPESWKYFNRLTFLNAYVKHRSSLSDYIPIVMDSSENASNGDGKDEEDLDESGVDDYDVSAWASGLSQVVTSGTHSVISARKRRLGRYDYQVEMRKQRKDQPSENQLHAQPQLDRLDHFGNFVAAQLRSKPELLIDVYLKQITDVLFTDLSKNADSSKRLSVQTKSTDESLTNKNVT